MPDKKGSDDRAYARGFAAGRAAATPDPPAAADLVAAHLRERWPCTCRPGMDGGGVYHAADCNSRREGSQAVLAVIRLLRAAAPPASPDERLREALALVYVMLTGAEPMWAEMPLDERCARAANEAQQAFLAADREAPDKPQEHTQECADAMFMHHAATGGDMECTCRAAADREAPDGGR